MQELLQHFINGISLGSIYALIALGYTMVYGVLNLINFAHADVYMIGAFVAYYTAQLFGLQAHPGFVSLFILLIASMVICSLLGVAIERLAYRPLRHAPKLNILITAIGVSLFLEYCGQIIFGADPKLFPVVIAESDLFTFLNVPIRSIDATILIVAFISMIGLRYIIFNTKTGRAMRAISTSSSLASLMGINVDRVISITFVIGSSLAGIGSILVGLKYPKIEPLMGMLVGLKAFVAAVLGGIGSIPGAVLGGLLMGLSEEMVVAYISSTYRDAFAFGILIIILVFKPTGLMGKTQVEKV
ncbi:MAG TPA: branched-chain amino acid ABC transporter permease [Thermodesulfovibrionia bacterium]|nr:branched-chain amino acid ABC transporter permease [Thermodesulfovibrionia bacterium]